MLWKTCAGEKGGGKGAGSGGGRTGLQLAWTAKRSREGYRSRVLVSDCVQGRMGVSGDLRGAGRCVHSDILITGAGAGWASAQ